jgi:hypothetical protein
MFSIGWQQKQFYVDLILLNFSKDSQRNDKSFGWHLLGPEFDAQWERISEAWVKKIPSLCLARSQVTSPARHPLAGLLQSEQS